MKYKFNIPNIVIDEPADIKVDAFTISYVVTNLISNEKTERTDRFYDMIERNNPFNFIIRKVGTRTIVELFKPNPLRSGWSDESFTLNDYNNYNYYKSSVGYFIKVGDDPNCVIDYKITFESNTNGVNLDYLTIKRSVDLTKSPESWGGEILFKEDEFDTIKYGNGLTYGNGLVFPSEFLSSEPMKEKYRDATNTMSSDSDVIMVLDSGSVINRGTPEWDSKIVDKNCLSVIKERNISINESSVYELLSKEKLETINKTFPTSLNTNSNFNFFNTDISCDGNMYTTKQEGWGQAYLDIDVELLDSEMAQKLADLKIIADDSAICHVIMTHNDGNNIMTLNDVHQRVGWAIFLNDVYCRVTAKNPSSDYNSILTTLDGEEWYFDSAGKMDILNGFKTRYLSGGTSQFIRENRINIDTTNDLVGPLYSQKSYFLAPDNTSNDLVYNTKLLNQSLLSTHKGKVRVTINCSDDNTNIDAQATMSDRNIKLSTCLSNDVRFELLDHDVIGRHYAKKYWFEDASGIYPSTISGVPICEESEIALYTQRVVDFENSEYITFNDLTPLYNKSCVDCGQTQANSFYGYKNLAYSSLGHYTYSDIANLKPDTYYLFITYIDRLMQATSQSTGMSGYYYNTSVEGWENIDNVSEITQYSTPSELQFKNVDGNNQLYNLNRIAFIVKSDYFVNKRFFVNPIFLELEEFTILKDPKDVNIIPLNKPLNSLIEGKVQDAHLLKIDKTQVGENYLRSYYIPPAIFNVVGNDQDISDL